MKRFKKTTDCYRLLDGNSINKLYNKNKKTLPQKYSDLTFRNIIEINNMILKEVSDCIVDNTSGVVLDGFGYFCIWRTPEKIKIRNLTKGSEEEYYFNSHSNGYFYLPTLFVDVYYRSFLRGWSMDGSFNRNIKSLMSHNIKRGHKYKILYSVVKSLGLKYKNKFTRKLIKMKKW